MIDALPNHSPARVSVSRRPLDERQCAELDCLALVLPPGELPRLPSALPAASRWLSRKNAGVSATRVAATSLDNRRGTRVFAVQVADLLAPTSAADAARRLAVACLDSRPESVGILVVGCAGETGAQLSAWTLEAFLINDFRLPNFASALPQAPRLRRLRLFAAVNGNDRLLAVSRANANNLARWLGAMPPNYLDATALRKAAQQVARDHGLTSRFYSVKQLKKMGAGAFCAVAQGNAVDDAGILRISYTPKSKTKLKRIALLGKGVIFDTGGNNLKPFRAMLDMHLDMQGSAVALAATKALAQLNYPHSVDCWLAITENRIGPDAYKSQDIITALNGKTIQTIHTDAEGRMALADTLTLAGRRKPDLMIDFATLTGSCVNAVTTRYSGVFSNAPQLYPMLKELGLRCAEPLWPFPMDAVFADDIRSEVADLVQCRVDGNGDHIYAAMFLKEFVPEGTPWVHIDLSAAQHKGGLGLVGSEITGVGARLGVELARELPRLLAAAANG
ncbi:MAG: leucyl aminopeptidase family protein [Pseudomonadota bacterium]